MRDHAASDGNRTAPIPSRNIFHGNARRFVTIGFLDGNSVNPIRVTPARVTPVRPGCAISRRPGESVARGNNTDLISLHADRSLSRHKAIRQIRNARRLDRIRRRRKQFHRHGKSVWEINMRNQYAKSVWKISYPLSIYRQVP
jgi:hypothetical protein